MMVGKFLSPLAFVRHVAVGTGNTTISMYAGQVGFISGVLSFEHRCPADAVCPVGKFNIIIIFFHVLDRHSVFPRKYKVRYSLFARQVFVEIIFNMALGTYHPSFCTSGSISTPSNVPAPKSSRIEATMISTRL